MNVKKLLKQAQFHGLNKLDDAKFRGLWSISLFLILLPAICIAASIVLRFMEQPTFITRLERVDQKIEFPSVQVCPEIIYPELRVDEFLSQLNYPSNLNRSYIKSVIQQLAAFYSPDVSYTVKELQRIETVLDLNQIDVYSAAKRMTVPCEETLMRCRLFGEMKSCTELFKLEISQYGFCCIFNGRSLRSEIMQYGIHKVIPRSFYFTSSMGFGTGLILAINQSVQPVNVDLNYKWVSIDGGHAYIDSTVNGTPISPGTEMWLTHKLKGIHIDEDAVSLNTELRGCRLSKEPLNFFPIHHKKYCQLECEIHFLLKTCGCGMWTHPLPPGAPLCNAQSLSCARKALVEFDKGACPCVHTCDVDTDFEEISSFRLIQHSACLDSFYHGLDFAKTCIMRVFTEKRVVKTKLRMAYYTFHDLFGQLGGIFNVFFGCSILSILEIMQIIKYAYQVEGKPNKYLKNSKQVKKKEVISKNTATKCKKKEKSEI